MTTLQSNNSRISKIHIFAYMRRSTTKKEQQESLLQQEEGIKEIAKIKNIDLKDIEFYTESKSGFKNKKRLEWNKMIEKIDELWKKGIKSTILCRDSSRLSRNPTDNLIVTDRLYGDNAFHKKPAIDKIYMLGETINDVTEWNSQTDESMITDELSNNFKQSILNRKKSQIGTALKLNAGSYPYKSPRGLTKVNSEGYPAGKGELVWLKETPEIPFVKRIFEMKSEGKSAKSMSKYFQDFTNKYIAPKKIVELIIQNSVYYGEYIDKNTGEIKKINFWAKIPPIAKDLWDRANASIGKRGNGYGEKQSEHLFLGKIKTQDGTTFQIYTAKGKTGKGQHLNYKGTVKNEKGKVVNVYISETNILQFLSEEISHIARKIIDKFEAYKSRIVHNQTLDNLYENLRSLPEFMNVEEYELRMRTLELKEAFDSYLEGKMADNNLTNGKYENFANLITGIGNGGCNEIDTGSAILSLTAEKTSQMNDDLFHKTDEMQSYFMNIMALRNSVIEEVFADSPFINDLKKELSNQEEAIEKLKTDKSALESEIKGVYEKAFKLGFKREFADDEANKMEERLNQIDVAINELESNRKLSDLLDKLPGILAKIVELSSQALGKAKLRERREEIKLILEIIGVELQIDNKKELKIKLFEGLEGMLDGENGKWSHERELNP